MNQNKIIKGDIFTSKCQTLVQSCNIFGFGLDYEFKKRFPKAIDSYERSCKSGNLKIGNLCFHRNLETDRISKEIHNILFFPTHDHLIQPSSINNIELALKKFVENYKVLEITSIAFPLFECGLEIFSIKETEPMMRNYLDNLDLEIEYYIPI